MQPEIQKKKRKIPQSHSLVWLTACLLAVLVVATIAVVGTCIYRYANRSDCQISLYDGQVRQDTAKNVASQKTVDPVVKSQAAEYSGTQAKQQSEKSAFKVSDAEQVWKTETAVDLFKASYKNADGTVTVKSADDSAVIAPGTEGSYTFSLKNTSEASAEYKVWVEAKLSSNMTGVPLQTRMSSDDGWLLGDKTNWEQATALDGVAQTETIDAGKTAEYTIYWQWPYEQGQDETDTGLGNASVEQNMSYTVTIYTLTAAATTVDGKDQQKKPTSILEVVKTGDTAQIFLWAAALGVSAGIIIWLLFLKKRKNDKDNEHDETKQ